MTELIEVGQSELADFRQCPLKHRIRWTKGWYQPVAGGSSALGTLWHAVQATHYRFKMAKEKVGGTYTVDEAREVMLGAIEDLEESEEADTEQADLLEWMANGFLERWGTDGDWEILAVEERMRVPLVDPDRPRAKPRFLFRFNADLIVRIRSLDLVAIVDNKTVASQGQMNKADLDLDDQPGLYIVGATLDGRFGPVHYAMLNQVRRDKLKRPMTLQERFYRPTTLRPKAELAEITRDALADMERMHGEANLRRSSSAPNPKQCAWKCDFKEAHITLRQSGGDWDEAENMLRSAGYSQDRENDPALANR